MARDIAMAAGVMVIGYTFIPKIENLALRSLAWLAYGYLEGLIMTGLWVSFLLREERLISGILIPFQVLGHECGHSAFSPSEFLNHIAGFIFHSFLLTPYFSWRSTHRRHHIYANNLMKDQNFVPPDRNEYVLRLSSSMLHIHGLFEDAPLYTLSRIMLQQLLGWQWYLLTGITGAKGCLARPPSRFALGNSHFSPSSSLFRADEWDVILLSDLGIGFMVLVLWYASHKYGWQVTLLLYFQPYLWVNHWIVAITYLHHTHPDVPKYDNEAWTFIKGATATVDREIGWGAKFFMHNVAEYHVIHHIFP
jgi:fatty acid desaturase